MPIYMPNAVVLRPVALDAWNVPPTPPIPPAPPATDPYVQIIAHPALRHVPRRVQVMNALRPGIEAVWTHPPASVMEAMWTARWRLEIDISGAGVTHSRDLELNEVADPPVERSWRTAFSEVNQASYNETEYGDGDPANWLSVSVEVRADNIWFAWQTGEWWPGLDVTVLARDFSAAPDDFSSAVAGEFGEGFDNGNSGVVVSIGDDEITLPHGFSDGFALTGTIKLTALDPLEIL